MLPFDGLNQFFLDEVVELVRQSLDKGRVRVLELETDGGLIDFLYFIDGGPVRLSSERGRFPIGEEARLPVHIFHLKAAGQDNWHLMSAALKLIADTRARGIDITADIYPYIRNGIGLGSFLNPSHYAHGAEPFLKTLGDGKVRGELRREVEKTSDWENWYQHVGRDWDNVLITSVGARGNKEYIGLSVKQVAEKRGIDQWDAFFDLVQQDPRFMRPAEVELLIGDSTKARTTLGWKPTVGFHELVAMMVDNDLAQQKLVAGI